MSADLASARTNMVDCQVRTQDVTDLAVIEAMRRIRRETLVPDGKTYLAYADAEIEYAPGRWMLRPRDVGKLLQALRPRRGEKALAVAAPYAASVLEAIGLAVTALSHGDLHAVVGDFDVVVCEGAVSSTPAAWLASLAIGGRLGVVERNGPVGHALLYLRSGAGVGRRILFDSTPPVLAGFEAEHRFAL
ncbi:MAG TPA: protein-L-isoaspartate O-methyltransferase [Caulobacteraceae bacterium]